MMSRWLPTGMFCQLLFSGLWFGLAGGVLVAQQAPRPMPEPDTDVALWRQRRELPADLYESRLLIRVLGLMPEQRRQIQEIRRQEGPTLNAARREVLRRRQALTEALYGTESSESLVEQCARDLASAEANLTQLRARMQYRIRMVLTPDQVRILNELRAEPKTPQPLTPERPGQRHPGRSPLP
ncbi:MAG: Spy/CpxP family protein refolding chaperone [Acidobacteriota bacterium]